MISSDTNLRESKIVHRRIIFSFVFVTLLVGVLITRLTYIQISQHQRFSTQAQFNSIRLAPLAPIRGPIYDRNGDTLAENFRVYNLEILPDQVEDMDDLLDDLRQLVELTEENLTRFKELLKRRPSYERQILRANLSEEEAASVAINQHRYPGAGLHARLQRNYPYGESTSHVVGYVGRISANDIANIDQQAYRGLGYIGRTGIESHYESVLHGSPGIERVETNAHGRVMRRLEQTAPDTGQTVHLSLDIELQRESMAALQGYEGAVVALEPDSGEILAFVSAPGFDPNPFVNGISKKEYAALRSAEGKPLLNRALYGRYAPGSTIKGFMMLVGMDNGINPNKHINCPGWFKLPKRSHLFRDWKVGGHGRVNGHDSIEQSCDVYFYRLASQLGIERIHEGLTELGFGKQTGIDLSDEPSGLVPSRKWKREARKEIWYPGETVISGIGQGYLLATPLQLAVATATLANRGRRVTPKILSAVESPATGVRRAIATESVVLKQPENFDANQLDAYQYVVDSMRDVVHGDIGTARRIGSNIRYQMAGKTGTSQVKSIPQGETYVASEVEKKFRDHSLFIAFAPLDNPKIALAVVVEHAGSGSATAAPIARRLIDFYLIKRLGMFKPTDTNEG